MDNSMTVAEILILIRLIVAHIVSDFLLQPGSWVKSKNRGRLRSRYFYFHGLVTGLTAYLFLGHWNNPWPAVIIMVTHMIIDWIKSRVRPGLKSFTIDQLVHLLVILLIWIFLTGTWELIAGFLLVQVQDYRLWVLLTGYLIILFPAGLFINIATLPWRNQLINPEGLIKAGQWIGMLERFLIVTFVLLNRYEAIGFLIAAKSIFRFGEISKDKERKNAEYFLIGTLISLVTAFVTGLLMKALLN